MRVLSELERRMKELSERVSHCSEVLEKLHRRAAELCNHSEAVVREYRSIEPTLYVPAVSETRRAN